MVDIQPQRDLNGEAKCRDHKKELRRQKWRKKKTEHMKITNGISRGFEHHGSPSAEGK